MKIHDTYSAIEEEIAVLLFAALGRGWIATDLTIRKRKLHDLLAAEKREETFLLERENLTLNLAKHGYLQKISKDSKESTGIFTLIEKKLEPIFKEFKKTQQSAYFNLPKNFVEIKHCKTIEQTEKIDEKIYDNAAKQCLICKEPTEKPASHFIETHSTSSSGQNAFKVSFKLDSTHKQLEVDIFGYENLLKKLKIKLVHLMHDDESDLKTTWTVKNGACHYMKISLTRPYFKEQDKEYVLLIIAENSGTEIIELYRFTIKGSLNDYLKKWRLEKMLKSDKARPEKLREYWADKKLMKYFRKKFKFEQPNSEIDSNGETLVELHNKNYKLNAKNYSRDFKTLVEVNDLYLNHQIKRIVLNNVKITKTFEVFCLNMVPFDVNKNLEVVEEGDFILLSKMIPNTRKIGRPKKFTIWKIENDCLFFDDEDHVLQKVEESVYQVRFEKDRFCTKLEQKAINLIDDSMLKNILFPVAYGTHEKSSSSLKLTYANPSIETNLEQQNAIKNVVKRSSYPAPYIIFGPPGTGKTSTIVETIVQIRKQNPLAKILVTAPSNFACDEIASRLLKYVYAEDLFRFYSRAVVKRIDSISEDLILISNLTKIEPLIKKKGQKARVAYKRMDDIFKALLEFPIILMTVATSGRLGMFGTRRNHFEYIFLDECGSSTEPSSLIPISSLVSFKKPGQTNIVIAGDPKQLGPVVKCDFSSESFLGTSLLERLMNLELYKPNQAARKYNEKVITKLLQNFRSHEAILEMPNRLFYSNELIPKASEKIKNFALNWTYLPNKTFPMVFHAVDGKSESVEKSFSLYNDKEINQVFAYIREIVKNGINGGAVPLNEIGVVSPYKLQVQKILKKLKDSGWKDIEVGSAEQFQGKEKMVIILSTVRSNTKTVGFLSSPKRLNVTITRAKSLLIIIGNPHTLKMDSNWYQLLSYCKENKATLGMEFDIETDLNHNFEKLDLNGNEV